MDDSKERLIQFFHHTHLVSTEKSEEFALPFKKKYLRKNEFFLREGQISDEYLFLEEGCMRAFAYDTNGNDITTNFCTPSQIVFEIYSFFNRTAAKENIQAMTDCTGWFITYRELNHLFHTIPEFREFGRYILVHGFGALKIRMLSMITETAEERYASLLISHPEIFAYSPLKNIATFLGITDTSLSRIRREFLKK